MKLIDILVQELPKRGGWCDGVAFIVQDYDGEIKGASEHANLSRSSGVWTRSGQKEMVMEPFKLPPADDHVTAIVTRKQYEAALKQSVWDGTGLPPVGCECEYRFPNVNYRSTFSRGKVLAYGAQKVFMEHWSSKNEFIQPLDNIEFRPIRTERDEAIEEMRKVVTNYNKTDVIHAIEQLYDAGYRKQ